MANRDIIEIDISDAIRGLDNIEEKATGTGVLMATIAEILQEGVLQNYEKEMGPDGPWPELAEATKDDREKHGYDREGPMLIRSRQLQSSLQPYSGKKEAHVATNKIYAPIQFLGGKAGPGRKVEIPGRNPMWINDETSNEIDAEVDDWFDDV